MRVSRANLLVQLLLTAGIYILATIPPAQAEPRTLIEYEVKAAFIYHFARFVEWPEEVVRDGGSFVIGIVGDDPFGDLIDAVVSEKNVRDERMTVKRFSKIEEAADSQILFVSRSEEENLTEILKHLSRAPVLTVSDIERFAGKGGMVQLVMDQNRIHFAVNVAAFDRAGLKPSSQLLKLARIVPDGGADKGSPPEEGYSGFFIYPPKSVSFEIENQISRPGPLRTSRSGLSFSPVS